MHQNTSSLLDAPPPADLSMSTTTKPLDSAAANTIAGGGTKQPQQQRMPAPVLGEEVLKARSPTPVPIQSTAGRSWSMTSLLRPCSFKCHLSLIERKIDCDSLLVASHPCLSSLWWLLWSLDSSCRGYSCEMLIVGGLVGVFK